MSEYLEETENDLEDDLENEDLEDTTKDRGDIADEDLDEVEEEEEEEEEEEGKEEDLDEEEDSDIKVPKSRLDKVISQREAEKERVEWLEDQLEKLINQSTIDKTPENEEELPSYDFEEAEQKYGELLIEGDTSKAATLRRTIDSERKKEMVALINEVKESSLEVATSTSAAAMEDDKFNTMVENFENKHSFLDADSEDYNEEAVDTVNTLLSGFVASGKTKTQALKLAVSRSIPMYQRSTPDKEKLGGKKAARVKAAKASNAQPPNTTSKGVKGVDTETVDVSKLSEKDFDSLTSKEKRILRGD